MGDRKKQFESCSDGRKLLWGAELIHSPEISEEDLIDLQSEMADSFQRIEKWDLIVERIEVGVSDDGAPFIRSAPPEEFLSNLRVDCPEALERHSVRSCWECRCIWPDRTQHRDNGCPVATIDEVMST
ncbi:MAG: hypothetical protein BWY99_01933 [Synergistetes bacterium ADurb.BinA166]|nr:MAG: hypothetical protein BWY99_01933 [Synergistetes bacterium ADurb.BinA166]